MIPWRVKNFCERHYYEHRHADYVDVHRTGGMISFTFDDFPVSAYETAGALLMERGWRGTYYTAAGLAGTCGLLGPLFSRDMLDRCHDSGHEIADHTFSHANCQDLDRGGLHRERAQNSAALAAYPVQNFAFPFGAHGYRSTAVLAPHFRSLRTVTPGINGKGTDRKRLKANALYEHRPLDDMLRLIERAQAEGGWIILYTHDVANAPSPYGCTPATFRTLLAAVERCGLTVGTVRQCLDLIEDPPAGSPPIAETAHAGQSRE